MIKIDQ